MRKEFSELIEACLSGNEDAAKGLEHILRRCGSYEASVRKDFTLEYLYPDLELVIPTSIECNEIVRILRASLERNDKLLYPVLIALQRSVRPSDAEVLCRHVELYNGEFIDAELMIGAITLLSEILAGRNRLPKLTKLKVRAALTHARAVGNAPMSSGHTVRYFANLALATFFSDEISASELASDG